jgi:hypothetical protein
VIYDKAMGIFGPGMPAGSDPYDHVNVEFEQQSYIGRHTGKMRSSGNMREVISDFYREDPSKIKKSYVHMDQSGNIIEHNINISEEDNTLG